MKGINYITLFLLLPLLWTCKKEKYPESVIDNEGTYYAEMDVEGVPLQVKAGERSYYMYSEFNQDSDRVYNFFSSLRSAACANCETSIQFQLNAFENSAVNASVKIDTLCTAGNRTYQREGRGPFYTVELNGAYNRSAQTSNYNWDFGDGSTASGVTVSKTFEFPGPYSICLRVKGQNGCESSSCNNQDLGTGALRVGVSSSTAAGDTVKFSAQVTGGKAPYTYFWNFGDGLTRSGVKVSHVYAVRGTYGVVVSVRDSSGKSISVNYNAITANDPSGCVANYSVSAVQKSTTGIQNWGKTSIRLTMADGNVYSTQRTDQPASSRFEILSAAPAGVNEKGESIYKLKIRFAATLFNGTKFIKISNGEAVIAVAYK